jgi:hypothetical protein
MNLRSTLTLAIAALCGALALGSCRTASREEAPSLARLAPVSSAAAKGDVATVVPALALAVAGEDRARAYERAVAQAALEYEFAKQSCQALSNAARGACLDSAFAQFSDARAQAHVARMSLAAVDG